MCEYEEEAVNMLNYLDSKRQEKTNVKLLNHILSKTYLKGLL